MIPPPRALVAVVLVFALPGLGCPGADEASSGPSVVASPAPSVGVVSAAAVPPNGHGLLGRVRAPSLHRDALPAGDRCDGGDPRDSWRVGTEGGLADVIVQARPLERPGRPEARSSSPDPVSWDLAIEGCRFVPRVSLVGPETILRVKHADPGLHTFHLYGLRDGGHEESLQNLAVAPGAPPLEWILQRPQLVHVRSDQVPWMEAWIRVSDLPSALTDAEGRFELPDLGPGNWEISMWHERLGEHLVQVTVPDDGPGSLDAEFPASR